MRRGIPGTSQAVAAVSAALAFVACLIPEPAPAVAKERPKLEVTYKLSCSDADLPSCVKSLEKALQVRADTYGLEGIQFRTSSPSGVSVSVIDRPGATEVLTRPGRLSLHLVDDSTETWSKLADLPEGAQLATWAGVKGQYHEISSDAEATLLRAFNGLPEDREVGISVNPEPSESAGIFGGIVLFEKPAVPPGSIASAKAAASSNEAGMPAVLVELNAQGAKALEEITGANLGQRLAVVVDGEVIHAPKIREAIVGGKVQLTKCAWRVKLNAADLARAYAAVLAAPLPEEAEPGSPTPSAK